MLSRLVSLDWFGSLGLTQFGLLLPSLTDARRALRPLRPAGYLTG